MLRNSASKLFLSNCRLKCLVMSSAEKKPKRDPYRAVLNYRNTKPHKFVPGQGPRTRVDTKWNENNHDIDDYSKMMTRSASEVNINISDALFNIETLPRTRIDHLENGLERVNIFSNLNSFCNNDNSSDPLIKLKIPPAHALLNQGEEIDEETPITSVKVNDIKTYIMFSSHNLDRLKTNSVNGLFPRLPIMLYSLSSRDDTNYEIVCPPPNILVKCYETLFLSHPNGAEQFVKLSFEKERLNEELATKIKSGKTLDYNWPVGYTFDISDADGSPASITNIFSKDMLPYKPLDEQLRIYEQNINAHRRGQYGSIMSKRGIYYIYFFYSNFVAFCTILLKSLHRKSNILFSYWSLPSISFSSPKNIVCIMYFKKLVKLLFYPNGIVYFVILVFLSIIFARLTTYFFKNFLGYPINDLTRISNLMDLPTLEHICKILKSHFCCVIVSHLGMLDMYKEDHYTLDHKAALIKLREIKADTFTACPLALRQLQNVSIRNRKNPRQSQRPLNAEEYRHQLENQDKPSLLSPSPNSSAQSPQNITHDPDIVRRISVLEAQNANMVTTEVLKKELIENGKCWTKSMLEMKQDIEANRARNLQLLEQQSRLEVLTAQNTLRSHKNETLLSTLASYTVAINPAPLQTPGFSEAFKPVATHEIGHKIQASIVAAKKAKELSQSGFSHFKNFDQLPKPSISLDTKHVPKPLPSIPYHAATNNSVVTNAKHRLNLEACSDLESSLNHNVDHPLPIEDGQPVGMDIGDDPGLNGDFQNDWSLPSPRKTQPKPIFSSTLPISSQDDSSIFKTPEVPSPKVYDIFSPIRSPKKLLSKNDTSPCTSPIKSKISKIKLASTDSPKRKRSVSPLVSSKKNKVESLETPGPSHIPNSPTVFINTSVLNHPNFNTKLYLDNLHIQLWPTFKDFDFNVTTVGPDDLDTYRIFYYVSLGFPNLLFEILNNAAYELEPFYSDSNALQVVELRNISNEATFTLINNFPLLCAALGNEVMQTEMLESDPENVMLNYKSFPVSALLINYILTYMAKFDIPLPNLTLSNTLNFLRLQFVVDNPHYEKRYFPTDDNAKFIKKYKRKMLAAKKQHQVKTRRRMPPREKSPRSKTSSATLNPSPSPPTVSTAISPAQSPTTSSSAYNLAGSSSETSRNARITRSTSHPPSSANDRLVQLPLIDQHYISPKSQSANTDSLTTKISKKIKKKLSDLKLGEISLTLSHEQDVENPSLPHSDQLHHASGDQASDHYFSLDGFFIPKEINEKMLHPKQPMPGPIPNFRKPTSFDRIESLTPSLRQKINSNLIRLQTKRRNDHFSKIHVPKLDTDITIVSTNLNNPVSQLHKLIQNLDNPPIICVNELKLTTNEIRAATFYPKNYTPYFTYSKYKNFEFVFSLILVSDQLKCSVKQIKTVCPFTMIDIEFFLSNGERATLNVCTFYRPHHKSKFQKLMNIKDDQYFTFFEQHFDKIITLQRDKNSILTGDLNCQYAKPRKQDNKQFAHYFYHKTSQYKDLADRFTNYPTLGNDGKSRIDVCLVKGLVPKFSQRSGRRFCNNDGHEIFKLDYSLQCMLDHSFNVVHTFTKTTPVAIYHESLRLLHQTKPELDKLRIEAMEIVKARKKENRFEPMTEPIKYVSRIINLFEEVMDNLVKPITVKINKFSPNPTLSTATKLVRNNLNDLIDKSSDSALSDSELLELHSAAKNLPFMMREDRQMLLCGYIEKNQSHPLTQSQKHKVNRDFNKKNKNALDPSLDLEKLTAIYEKQLNTFREKPFKPHQFNTKIRTKLGTKDFQIKWHGKSKQDSIYKAFLQTRDTTCGYNSKLNKNVFGCFSNEYIALVVDLIFICLEAGYFPFEMKNSKVIAINKCKLRVPDKDQLYRLRWLGIQLHLCCIMMKFVSANFTAHLERDRLLPTTQHAFRKNFSTSTALNEIFLNLNKIPKDSGFPILVMIDINKAFDSVCHKLLDQKLHEICEPNIARFLSEDHTNRFSHVVFNGISSKPIPNPNYGVYQGGCLSPSEFSLFLFDLSFSTQFMSDTNNILYADDISVVSAAKLENAPSTVVRIEKQIRTYLEALNMSMLPGKTAVMIIGMNDIIKYGPEDNTRQTCLSTKLLGVTFGSNLFDNNPKDHPFKKEIFLRIQKLIEYRGTLFYIQAMGHSKYRRELASLFCFGTVNYAFEDIPVLPHKLYNKLNKHMSQLIIDQWGLDQYPKVNYSYSYLFKLANWHNAQLSHAYNTLNYLNRVLYSHNPPLAYKESMSILFVGGKPFSNPNSQLESERKTALMNFRLGKAPHVIITSQVRSRKFFPYNIPDFCKRVPNYILSHLGRPTFKPLLKQHFKNICNHGSGNSDCKYCKHFDTQLRNLTHLRNDISNTNTVSNLFGSVSHNDAITLLDDLHEFAISTPLINFASYKFSTYTKPNKGFLDQ